MLDPDTRFSFSPTSLHSKKLRFFLHSISFLITLCFDQFPLMSRLSLQNTVYVNFESSSLLLV